MSVEHVTPIQEPLSPTVPGATPVIDRPALAIGRWTFAFQVVGFAVVALGVIVGYAYSATHSSALILPYLNGERLLFEPTQIDLGSVPSDQEIESHIRVVNLSSRSMTLHGAQESCGCLTVQEFPVTLESGKDQMLSVKLHSAKDAGPFQHTVKFFTNDPKRSSTIVSISGVVQ